MKKEVQPIEGVIDRRYVEQLYLEHRRLILAVAEKYVADPDDREDVIQGTAERIIRYIHKLKQLEPKACAAYITYITKSVALDLQRSRMRERKLFYNIEDGELKECRDNPLENDIILKDQLGQLREVWHDLPEDDQLLLEGKYIWELPDQELAGILGCKTGSIRMKLTRARRKTYQLLKEREEVQ